MAIYDHLSDLPGQINVSLMYAGAVKAWHRHRLQDDHWVVTSGCLKIGLFNTEADVLTAELRLAGPGPNLDQEVRLEIPPNAGVPFTWGASAGSAADSGGFGMGSGGGRAHDLTHVLRDANTIRLIG